MIHQLHDKAIHQFVVKSLSEQIELDMNGYHLTNAMAWDVMLKAASEGRSIASVSEELIGSVHHNTLRGSLNARFEVSRLEEQMLEQNRVLAASIPQSLRGCSVEIAIDTHDEASYSKDETTRMYTCRSKAKQGTTYFWRIASAYVMKDGQRVTVALMYVLPEHQTLDVVKYLLHRVQQAGLGIACLYMDKGFCSTAVIRYLKAASIPAIIACPIKGKTGGTRALCQQRASYCADYTFGDGTQATIACVRTYPRNKHGRRRLKWLLFITIGIRWSPQKVKHRYRRRFGIEASYRQMRQLRIYSTSRNPALRFFFLGLAFLLLNIWTLLRWSCTRHPGTRRIHKEWFDLARFKAFLRRVVERLHHAIDFVPSYLLPNVLKL